MLNNAIGDWYLIQFQSCYVLLYERVWISLQILQQLILIYENSCIKSKYFANNDNNWDMLFYFLTKINSIYKRALQTTVDNCGILD